VSAFAPVAASVIVGRKADQGKLAEAFEVSIEGNEANPGFVRQGSEIGVGEQARRQFRRHKRGELSVEPLGLCEHRDSGHSGKGLIQAHALDSVSALPDMSFGFVSKRTRLIALRRQKNLAASARRFQYEAADR
jgi:hypothetical protein